MVALLCILKAAWKTSSVEADTKQTGLGCVQRKLVKHWGEKNERQMSSLGVTATFSHFLNVKIQVEFFPVAHLQIQYSLLSHGNVPTSSSVVYFWQPNTFFHQFLLHLCFSLLHLM